MSKGLLPEVPSVPVTVEGIVSGAVRLGMAPVTAAFFEGQLRNCNRPKKGKRWSVQDKGRALGVFFKNKGAYQTMSSLFLMPSPSTLYRFVQGIPVVPGLSASVVNLLRIKASSMDNMTKYCVVTFDEMSLKKELKYNAQKDRVDGLVHLTERQPRACNQALVFMLRGLSKNWKQPLCYYFSDNAASAFHLRILLTRILDALFQIDLKPVVVVCDQGSCNRSLYNALCISQNSPYFLHGEHKVYAVHDVPHVLKNVRSTLKNQDIQFDDNKTASWKDVVAFYKYDQTLPVRLAPKLTDKHVFLPPFSPMRVCFAAQVCSHTVYAGMLTLVALGKLPPSASNTANFLKQVNNVFDFLNVRSIRGSKGYHPFTDSMQDLEVLEQHRANVEKWVTVNKSKVQPCFQALLQCLTAVQMLTTDLLTQCDFKYLLTGRINQDCIENLFAQVRAKGGHRFNPSAGEFQYAYRALSTNMLMAPVKGSNCDQDGDHLLASLHELSFKPLTASDSSEGSSTKRKAHDSDEGTTVENVSKRFKAREIDLVDRKADNESSVDTLPLLDTTNDFPLSSSVTNVINYIGGYIVNKLAFDARCRQCLEKLTKECKSVVEEQELMIHFKAYSHTSDAFGSLYVPSSSLLSYLKRVEKLFQRHVEAVLVLEKGVLSELMKLVSSTVPQLKLCAAHQEEADTVLKCYLKCRLHYYFKFQTTSLANSKKGKSRKTQILRHE